MASLVKLKSSLVVTNSAVFSQPVAALVPASTSSGAFQMCRYMCDSGDSLRRNSAPEGTESRGADQVDSSILETFDPLGYAQYSLQQRKDVEFDVPKDAAADLFVAFTSEDSSLSVDNPAVLSTSSSTSLVDVGIATSTHADVVATGSSVSVDTLTGCVRERTSLDAADSSESLNDQVGSRHAASCQSAGEFSARPKTTSSVPIFPPRISISHLSDGSIQSKSNGKQCSGLLEPAEDGAGNVVRSTAFHAVQGPSARPAARSGMVTGTSTNATTSVIEGASGLLSLRVSCCVSPFIYNLELY